MKTGLLALVCLLAALCGALMVMLFLAIPITHFMVLITSFMGAGLAFMAVKTAVFLRNVLFLGRIDSVKTLLRVSSLPILAPTMHSTQKEPDFHLLSSKDPAAKTLKNIAATLPPIVTIASESPAQGKSFTAANLALLSAQKRRTLLVDAQAGTGQLHRSFAMPAEPGFTEVMMGRATLEQALSKPVEGSLWLLAAGSEQPNYEPDPARVKLLLQELAQQFEVVIVDYPCVKNPKILEFFFSVYLIIRQGTKVVRLKNFLRAFRPAALILNDLK